MPLAPESVQQSKPKDDDKTFYISSDGKPMAETDQHVRLITYTVTALDHHFSAPDIYVAGNNFVHYRRGDGNAHLSPDSYVVKGVPKRLRDNYKVWEEGRNPSVVFEFTSEDTRRYDLTDKKDLYEQLLHVPELYLFDPTGKRRKIRLRGFFLREGRYEEQELQNDRLYSPELGLELVPDDTFLRFYDPVAGEYLRTYDEEADERVRALKRAAFETQRAEEEARRFDRAMTLANETLAFARAEKGRADEANIRADAEKKRADSVEAELALALAELEALRGR